MKLHPVILSSGKPNRYGFRVDPKGIDLSLMKKNGVLLYMHLRANESNPHIVPIGGVQDFAINEEGQLVANIRFNQKDHHAQRLEQMWEDSLLNAVSIKGEILEYSDDENLYMEGQTMYTVTKLLLEEVSVVDIPGDGDATAIRLHHKGQEALEIALAYDNNPDLDKLFPTNKSNQSMKLIQLAFAGQKMVTLAKNADEEALANAVTELVNTAQDNADKVVQLSTEVKTKSDKITELEKKIEQVELSSKQDRANTMVDAAIAAKKITAAEKDSFVELALTNPDAVKKILDAKKGFTSITEELGKQGGEGGGSKYAELSWRELDKQGKLEAYKAADFDGFKAKFKEQFGVDYKS